MVRLKPDPTYHGDADPEGPHRIYFVVFGGPAVGSILSSAESFSSVST